MASPGSAGAAEPVKGLSLVRGTYSARPEASPCKPRSRAAKAKTPHQNSPASTPAGTRCEIRRGAGGAPAQRETGADACRAYTAGGARWRRASVARTGHRAAAQASIPGHRPAHAPTPRVLPSAEAAPHRHARAHARAHADARAHAPPLHGEARHARAPEHRPPNDPARHAPRHGQSGTRPARRAGSGEACEAV